MCYESTTALTKLTIKKGMFQRWLQGSTASGKLSHAGALRQKKSDEQDLMGGKNLPLCWLNSQQVAAPGVAVPASSHQHQSV